MNYTIVQYKINRYAFNKELIANGTLIRSNVFRSEYLRYFDDSINLSVSDPDFSIFALIKLRLKLEADYQSFLNCNGCRIDTMLVPRGKEISWKFETGKQPNSHEFVHLFDPTGCIDKLTTVSEHRKAFETWLKNTGWHRGDN